MFGARPAAFGLVIVGGIEVESSEGIENAELPAALDIFGEGGSYGFFLGFVLSNALGFRDQVVIEGEVGGHVYSVTHTDVWSKRGKVCSLFARLEIRGLFPG
jgi:hypothetical protein